MMNLLEPINLRREVMLLFVQKMGDYLGDSWYNNLSHLMGVIVNKHKISEISFW